MHTFVRGQDKTILEIVHVSSVMVKDPFLRLGQKMGPTMDLTIARKGLSVALEEEEEEEEAPSTPSQKKKTPLARLKKSLS